jgi:predicted MFS family arabinose efflux permease
MPQSVAVHGPARTDRRTHTFISAFSATLYAVLLIAPVIAGKLIERFDLTPVEVGGLFSLELAAFSLASLPAFIWQRRLNLRTATYVFTALVVAGHIASGMVDNFTALMVIRFLTSFAAGSISVILLSLSGKTSNPSRSFGFFVVSQLVMGALILAVFPIVFANSGVAAIYWSLAGLTALCLPMVRYLDPNALRQAPSAPSAGIPQTGPSPRSAVGLVLGLAALLMFYIALSSVWTFIAQISAESGIDLTASSLALSAATVVGIISALIAVVLGDTPRRSLFLMIGYLALAAGIALLFGAPGLVRFTIAAIVFKFAWTFVLPYLLSALSDLGGAHLMSTVNLTIGAGFAIGPLLGGSLIENNDGYGALLAMALAGILISTACAWGLQRNLRISKADHHSLSQPDTSTPPIEERPDREAATTH